MVVVQIQRKHPLAICEACPLVEQACAGSSGPVNAKLAVVSRSPGYYEAMNGEVFAGPSGKVLNHLLYLQGVERDEVFATNIVLCQVPESMVTDKVAVPEQAVTACSARLAADIAEAETVIAAGAEAVRALLGGTASIHRDRGYPHERIAKNGKKQRVIVTNNPAMVIRDDGTFPELVRDFRLAINPLPKPKLPEVTSIDDIEEAKQAVEKMLGSLQAGTLLSSDIEARGIDGESGLSKDAELVCAGFSVRPERAVVFGECPCSDDRFRIDYLRRLYEFEGLRYLWHNGKYDIKILRTLGINATLDEDSMLLSWALDERPGNPESGAGGHSLEWLLKDELGWPKYEPDSVRIFKKTGELNSNSDRRSLYRYNGFDTAGALGLFSSLAERAKLDGVWDRPYKSLLIRLSETLTRVELQGNAFDADIAMDILEEEVWPKLRDWKRELRDISGKPELNPNSSQQLGRLIYDEWGIKHNLARPKIERKGKRSTDHAVREEIMRGDYTVSNTATAHESEGNRTAIERDTIEQFTSKLDLWKSLEKQRGTYFEGLVLKRGKDGRIYTDFKIHGTESGRLSSSNPNMQNVTRPKEGLPSIRAAFIADPGCVLLSADLSQAELRTIAYLSGDTNLRAIYLDTSRSLHKEVAEQFYGADYTYEQYVRAKNINFSAVYWISAHSLTQYYGVPADEAQPFIDFWWERFPQVWEWTKSIEDKVLNIGELQSPYGHKRRFYVIPSDRGGRVHVVKEGINFLPQNIAANTTLWALCNIAEKLDWSIAQPRITVHDSIVLNCREEHVQKVATFVKAEMERAWKEAIGWDFPMKADITIGENWGALEDYVP